MVPRNGDRPTLFFKAFDSPDVQSDLLADGREPHQSLMRFGLWIMFGIAISPKPLRYTPRPSNAKAGPSCFWENPAREKAPIPGCGRSTFPEHGCSTTTARLSGCTRGRRPLSDRPGAARPLLPHISRPIAGIVRLSQAPANEITRLSILRAVGSLLPSCPGIRLRQRFAG